MDFTDPHWKNLTPPLSPSLEDVATYEHLIVDRPVLLLGSTKELLHLADAAIDAHPQYDDPKIVQQNWLEFHINVATVICDGGFNFNKPLTSALLAIFSTKCKRLIVRSFNRRLPEMKYALHFPTVLDFPIQPKIHSFDEYANFFVWDFKPLPSCIGY